MPCGDLGLAFLHFPEVRLEPGLEHLGVVLHGDGGDSVVRQGVLPAGAHVDLRQFERPALWHEHLPPQPVANLVRLMHLLNVPVLDLGLLGPHPAGDALTEQHQLVE